MGSAPRRGLAAVLLAGVLWGTLGPVGKHLIDLGIDPWTLVVSRALLAWGGAALFLLVRQPGALKIRARELPLLAGYGMFGVGGMYAGFFLSLKSISVALAEVLFYIFPLLIAFASPFVTGEKPTRRQLAACFVTLAGVSVAVLPHLLQPSAASLEGIGWILLAACAMAVYTLFGRRAALTGSPAPPTLFVYGLFFGGVALAGAKTLATGWSDLAHLPSAGLGWLLFLGFGGTLCGYAVFQYGLRYVKAAVAGVIGAVEMVVAITFAALLSGRAPAIHEIAGAALVICAIVLAAVEQSPEGSRSHSET